MHRSVRLGTKRRDNYLRHCTLGHTRPRTKTTMIRSAHKTGSRRLKLTRSDSFISPASPQGTFGQKKTLTAKLFNVYIQLDLENRPRDISRSRNKNIFQAADEDSPETTKLPTSLLLPRTSTDLPSQRIQSRVGDRGCRTTSMVLRASWVTLLCVPVVGHDVWRRRGEKGRGPGGVVLTVFHRC